MIHASNVDNTILEATHGSYDDDPLTKILLLEDEAERLLTRSDVITNDRIAFIRNHVTSNLR